MRTPCRAPFARLRLRARRMPALVVVLVAALLWQPLAVAFCAAHGGGAPAGARGGKVLLCTRDGYVERQLGQPVAPMPSGHAAYCQSCCLPALDWLALPMTSVALASQPETPADARGLSPSGSPPRAACARGPPAFSVQAEDFSS